MELKEGMVVKFKNRRGKFWNNEGKMDKYIGTKQVIKKVISNNKFKIIGGECDCCGYWTFFKDDIEEIIIIILGEI